MGPNILLLCRCTSARALVAGTLHTLFLKCFDIGIVTKAVRSNWPQTKYAMWALSLTPLKIVVLRHEFKLLTAASLYLANNG